MAGHRNTARQRGAGWAGGVAARRRLEPAGGADGYLAVLDVEPPAAEDGPGEARAEAQ
jgi:hypothetical protein